MSSRITITLTVENTDPKDVRDALIRAPQLKDKPFYWWLSLLSRLTNTIRDRVT